MKSEEVGVAYVLHLVNSAKQPHCAKLDSPCTLTILSMIYFLSFC